MGSGKAAGAVPVVLHMVRDHHRRGHSPPSLPHFQGSDGGGSQARHREKLADYSHAGQRFGCQDGVRNEWRRVIEGNVRRCTRGVPDTDRGELRPPEHDTCAIPRRTFSTPQGGEPMTLPDSTKRARRIPCDPATAWPPTDGHGANPKRQTMTENPTMLRYPRNGRPESRRGRRL